MKDIESGIKIKASVKRITYVTIRVRKETARHMHSELELINKKPFGRKVRADEYIHLAQSLLRPEHIEALQDASLSNSDRLERDYRAYAAEHGPISRDEYLGRRLKGEVEVRTHGKGAEKVL